MSVNTLFKSILDEPVPNLNTPTLKPTKYVAPAVFAVTTENKEDIEKWFDWLVNHVHKKIKTNVNTMKKNILKTLKNQETQHKRVMTESKERQAREAKQWAREINKEKTRRTKIIKESRWRGSKKRFRTIRNRLNSKLKNIYKQRKKCDLVQFQKLLRGIPVNGVLMVKIIKTR